MKIGGIVAAASVCAWCSLSAATCPEGVVEDSVRNAEVKFGIRLGERLPEKVVKTTVSPRSSFGRRMLLQNSSSYFCRERRQPLTPPFFGVLFADVSCDYDGRVMSIYIDDSFRRGLDRNESLAKINALRDEVSRRVGFDLVEYRFATSRSGTGVTKSDGGESVWLDMDTAFAVTITTSPVCVIRSIRSRRRSSSFSDIFRRMSRRRPRSRCWMTWRENFPSVTVSSCLGT